MIRTLQVLWGALSTTAQVEANSLLRVLYFYLFSIYIFAALQAAFPGMHNVMVTLGFAIIVANAYQLFKISRLIRITAAGELFEVSKIIPNTTGITSNDLIKLYWNIAVEMFIFISTLCIIIPRLPLHRQWYLPILLPTMSIAMAIIFGYLGRALIHISGIVAFILVAITMSRDTFPQIDAQLGLGGIVNWVLSSEAADQVNQIDRIREEQREVQISRDLSDVENWVRAHPNEPYSMEHQIFMEGIRKGERKTLTEVRDDIVKGKTSASASATTKPKNWEPVDHFPVPLSGNTFNRAPGANGERINTGEVYLCSLEHGYKYRFTLSGGYDKHYQLGWERGISWKGIHNSQRKGDPFPALAQGALMLRIGASESLHPQSGDSFEYLISSSGESVFAEVNFNRNIDEYFDPNRNSTNNGGKFMNSTLSVKIERMPL